jgi:hypothetical protein
MNTSRFKLSLILAVDNLLRTVGSALVGLSDRWLFVATAGTELETLLREGK